MQLLSTTFWKWTTTLLTLLEAHQTSEVAHIVALFSDLRLARSLKEQKPWSNVAVAPTHMARKKREQTSVLLGNTRR